MAMVPTEENEMPAPNVQGGAFEGMKENPFNFGANEGTCVETVCSICIASLMSCITVQRDNADNVLAGLD